MLAFKTVNQQLVQVAFACHHQPALLTRNLSRKNQKQLGQFIRTLVQSSAQSQKITNANNQQLIPVARNISFRKCHRSEHELGRKTETSTKAPFSISTANSSAPFVKADNIAQYVTIEQEQEASGSPIEVLKRRAKDVKEKRDLSAKSKYYGQSFNQAVATAPGQRLVVLLSWLEAKEKHIEKYRQIYLDRGFDVLNVKTSPWDLLLPNYGARKILEDFVRFMTEKRYSNVVLHGFSVGGYMFGRFLLEIERHDAEIREQLLNSIRGIIFDSLVPMEGIAVGVANSITSNRIGAKAIEKLLQMYLILGHNIATKYYLEASEVVWRGPLKCPTLFVMSKEDNISDHKIVERLADGWKNKGVDIHKLLVENSPHVQIYTKHHDKYVGRVDDFLKHIKAIPRTAV